MKKRDRPTETTWSNPPCSQRRKLDEEVPYIPEDIIFDILLRCPPEFLYDSARSVCKTWYNLIRNPRFTRDHLLRHAHDTTRDHTVGLLYDKNPLHRISQFLEISEGNVKLTYSRHPIPAQILATSYGVSLYYRIEKMAESLYVVNPVTKQVVRLPRPKFKRLRFDFRRGCISYLPGTEEIKVVIRVKNNVGGERYHWYVLTVGRKMSWRKVVKIINPENVTVRGDAINGMATCVGGVVYWNILDKVVAIDLSDEIIHYFYLPTAFKSRSSRFLEMGNRLCLIEITSSFRPGNVWIMKDLQQKEWDIVYNLDVDFKLKNAGLIFYSFPRLVGWLENEQMLVMEEYFRRPICSEFVFPCYEVVPMIVAYDVRTGKTTSCRGSSDISLHDIVVVHSSTLLSW